MRGATLPSLKGYITNGMHLRIAVARAISELEVYAKRGSTLPAGVAAYTTFLAAQTTALNAIKALPASIAVSPTTSALTSGAPTQQLAVTKVQVDGTTGVVVTPAASGTIYTTSNAAVATVSTAGLITRVGVGSAVITAQNGNKTATNAVTST